MGWIPAGEDIAAMCCRNQEKRQVLSLALAQPKIPSRKRFKQIGLCEGAKILDLDAKRSAPVDGLASWPGVPSPPPPSSPQIGQAGLNVTSAGS